MGATYCDECVCLSLSLYIGLLYVNVCMHACLSYRVSKHLNADEAIRDGPKNGTTDS